MDIAMHLMVAVQLTQYPEVEALWWPVICVSMDRVVNIATLATLSPAGAQDEERDSLS